MRRAPLAFIAALALFTACARGTRGASAADSSGTPPAAAVDTPAILGASPSGAVPLPASTRPDHAPIDSLERVARALVHTEGCAEAGQCRVAPLGARACGGPRDYVAYCTTSTDTLALFRALAALARAEKAYDASHGIASTCEMRLAPLSGIVAGRCSAGSDGGNAAPR